MKKKVVESPVGPLTLVSDGAALVGCGFANSSSAEARAAELGEDAVLRRAARQLEAYFAGKRTTFDVPLAPRGTEFQRSVWAQLSRIPFGETRTYGDLARQLGNPNAMRAVGAANGANPIAIIVPCHRVIGADGSLTGFGGGVERKRYLLELEQPQGGLFE